MTRLPIIVKGILAPEDAALAVQYGVDAIVVSNHGGRQLDYAPSALEVLPGVVAAVRGRVPVLMDGGIRRGTDIIKVGILPVQPSSPNRVPGCSGYADAPPPTCELGAWGPYDFLTCIRLVAAGMMGGVHLLFPALRRRWR